jgi:hypothetical protein
MSPVFFRNRSDFSRNAGNAANSVVFRA